MSELKQETKVRKQNAASNNRLEQDMFKKPETISAKKILIIDDEKSHQVMMKAWLALLNLHDVDIASTGREGLLLISRTDYSIIFLDIGLPDIDGYEVCRRIRKRKNGKTVPIIINTIRPMARQVWHKIGATGISLKPLLFHHLEYFIDRWLQPVSTFREYT